METGAYFVTLQYVLMGSVFIALLLVFLYAYYGKDDEKTKRLTFFKNYFRLDRLFKIINKAKLATVRIKLIAISQPASGPEPKTIGIGPIKIIPPTLPDPLKTMEATTKTTIPTKTKTIPKSKKPSNRPEILIP